MNLIVAMALTLASVLWTPTAAANASSPPDDVANPVIPIACNGLAFIPHLVKVVGYPLAESGYADNYEDKDKGAFLRREILDQGGMLAYFMSGSSRDADCYRFGDDSFDLPCTEYDAAMYQLFRGREPNPFRICENRD